MKNQKVMVIVLLGLLFLVGCTATKEGQVEPENKENKSVTIYLTRHGETLFNLTEKVQGWSDTPLTDNGEEVAADLGKGLKKEKVSFSAAYASDLKSAVDTAQLVLDNNDQKTLEITQMKGLREASYGSFEGDFIPESSVKLAEKRGFKTSEAFEKAAGKMYWNQLADTYKELDTVGIAENSAEVSQRMIEAIEKIAKDQKKAGGGNVLVVSHGMAINVMLSKLTDKYEGKPLKNVSVTKINFENDKLDVETIGETNYLELGKE